MNYRGVRTDLANEAVAFAHSTRGIRVEETRPFDGITVACITIENEEGERAIGKPVGRYVTIDAPGLSNNDTALQQNVAETVRDELRKLCGKLGDKETVLVAGLGNSAITADALGPKTASKVLVSRHVTEYLPDQIDERVRPVCAISPGVLGMTGVETGEVVLGVVEKVKPALVIAIDALASRSTERISTSIQLSNTGIRPGSGLGNGRMELTGESLGIPVIAIGVPTVVHASTISQDAVTLLLEEMGEKGGSDELVELVGKVVSEKIGPLVVTPKDIDMIIDRSASLLASGIDMALHGVTLDEARAVLM